MSKKLTAVEWLVLKLNQEGYAPVVTQEEYNQAKEMEKEQMIQFGDSICQDGFEEYVAETFDKKYGGNNG
jgi:hypothetical protein